MMCYVFFSSTKYAMFLSVLYGLQIKPVFCANTMNGLVQKPASYHYVTMFSQFILSFFARFSIITP